MTSSVRTGYYGGNPPAVDGVFEITADTSNTLGWQGGSSYGGVGYRFKASKYSSVFGRSTTEARPRAVSGVWLVRASGGFVAANTSWSVVNADAAAPANGTTVKGGKVRSVYKVGAAEYASAELQASVTTSSTGGRTVSAEVVVQDSTSGTTTSKTIKLGTLDGLSGGAVKSTIAVTPPPTASTAGNGMDPNNGMLIVDTVYPEHPTGNGVIGGQMWCRTLMNDTLLWQFGMYNNTNVGSDTTGVISMQNLEGVGRNVFWTFSNNGNATANNGAWINGVSDAAAKYEIEELPDPYGALDGIKARTWRLNTKANKGKYGIGVLANGLYDHFPDATLYAGDLEMDDGTVLKDALTVQAGDSGVTVAVLTAVLQDMVKRMDALESTVRALSGKALESGS